AKIAQPRVRMEGWRQRRPGSKASNPQEEKRKKEKNTLDSYRPSHGRHYTPEIVDTRSKYRPSPMRRAVQKEKYQRDKRLPVLAAWGPSIQSRPFQSSYPQREPPPRWHFHRLHLHPKWQ